MPTFRHCLFSGRLSTGRHCQERCLFYGLMQARDWQGDCILYWYSGETMISAEIQHSAKSLIVRLEGGCISNDTECVRVLTETIFGDPVGDATLSPFSRLGARSLAEEAYILDEYRRLDHRASLPGSPGSE